MGMLYDDFLVTGEMSKELEEMMKNRITDEEE